MKIRLSTDFLIDSELPPWNVEGLRIGMFGGPGSGKSWNAALTAESWLSQGGTVVIFQPRSEYHTLKEKFDIVVFGGAYNKDMDFLPVAPKTYAEAVAINGISMIFYTEDVEQEDKLVNFVAAFIRHLLKLQEVHKRPILLILEETQEYTPKNTKGREAPPWVFAKMIRAFKNCALQGRKLNVSVIALSPRPQEVDFTIRQLANLTLYGKFSRQDTGYIDREVFKPYKEKGSKISAKELVDLPSGKWLMVSGKTTEYITVDVPRMTKHGAETPKLSYTAPRDTKTRTSMDELAKTIALAIQKEQAEQSELTKEKAKVKKLTDGAEELKREIDQLNTALKVAGVIKIEHPNQTLPQAQVIVDETHKKRAEEAEEKLRKIREIVTETQPSKPVVSNLYKTWENKMPSLCAKRIFKYLLENNGVKYKQWELAVKLGYKKSAGTWAGAMRFLKQNNLIQTNNLYVWME